MRISMPILLMSEDRLREIIAEEVLLAIMCHESTIARADQLLLDITNASTVDNKLI
jgi:hypothetical protein